MLSYLRSSSSSTLLYSFWWFLTLSSIRKCKETKCCNLSHVKCYFYWTKTRRLNVEHNDFTLYSTLNLIKKKSLMSDFYLTLNSTFLKLHTDADIDKMGSQFELMITSRYDV